MSSSKSKVLKTEIYDVDRYKELPKAKSKDKKEHKHSSSKHKSSKHKSSSSKHSSKSKSAKPDWSEDELEEVKPVEEEPKRKRGRPSVAQAQANIVKKYETGKFSTRDKELRKFQPKVESTFANDTDKILTLLDNQENDNAISLVQKEALKSIIGMVAIAEGQYKQYPANTNAMALNGLVTQMRELISDLQANSDKSLVIDRIIYDILYPSITQIANFLIEINFQLKKDLEKFIIPEHKKEANSVLDAATKNSGGYIKELFLQLKTRIEKSLSET